MNSREYSEWLIDQLLYNSVQSIDARLGEGYHTKNPRLVCELTKLQYEEYKRQESFELEEAKVQKVQKVSSYNFTNSSVKKRSKKRSFTFGRFNIPVGAELECLLAPHIKFTVASKGHKISFKTRDGKCVETSMSAFANKILGGSQRGTEHFRYKGKLCSDMVDNQF